MSKYNPLWLYIKKQNSQSLQLYFKEIETICGIPIDHSFLQYTKELLAYGWQVKKISMKKQMIQFEKIE